jgi:predicted aconitase with swiveling domain
MMIDARALVSGSSAGPLLVLHEPLSLWGGLDFCSGAIIDRNHPQCGVVISGHIVAMPYARGSSSSSSALLEAARQGNAPAAILLQRADPILTIGALVAEELYRKVIPILLVEQQDWGILLNRSSARICALDEAHCRIDVE